jgi:peroxiredoxin
MVVGARKGNLAPDFNLKKIHGGQLELSSLKGKAVLIDFWDTWCPPCRKALPHLQEISDAYADDLVVVGIAMGRDGEKKVRDYVEQNNLTFPMVLADAPQYSVMRDFGGIQSIPTTFLIDRDGVIQEIWTGAMPKAEYEKAVRKVLGV